MLLTEYDEKKVMKMFFRDGRAEGLEAGRAEGELMKLIHLVRKMLKKQMTPAEIADMFDEDLNRIEQISETIQKSPEISDEEIYRNIFDNNNFVQ
jgi:predicted transposase YdaD